MGAVLSTWHTCIHQSEQETQQSLVNPRVCPHGKNIKRRKKMHKSRTFSIRMRGATIQHLLVEKSRVADDDDDGDSNDDEDDDDLRNFTHATIAAVSSGRTSSVQLPHAASASLCAPCQQRLSLRCRTKVLWNKKKK